MLAYHGTVVGGLHTLTPFASPHANLDYACVYLSTNEALAAIYIWKHPYKWMTFEIREDGMPVYNESYAGGLWELYGGVSGFIYACEGDFSVDEKTTIQHAVVSRQPVAVSSVDVVEDAYARILRYEGEGRLVVNRFEDLSDERRRKDRNMVLGAIERLSLLKGEHPLSSFVSTRFPALWGEALRAQK